MLRTADLDYELPEDRIATAPVTPRDAARLLVVSRSDPNRVEHCAVRDLPEVLGATRVRPGAPDLLVVNATRVLPARFAGVRTDTGGRVEGLYLRAVAGSPATRWQVLLKMRRMKPGVAVRLNDAAGNPGPVSLRLVERIGQDEGWLVEVEIHEEGEGSAPGALLDRVGLTPLPPYILAARKRLGEGIEERFDRDRYQTVFAAGEEGGGDGSVAAPTAGLHFTPELLARLEAAGVRRAEVELHVGTGTFKPVETEHVEEHPMHSERCSVSPRTGAAVAATRSGGGRVIAVGTTSARTLESFGMEELLAGGTRETRLLITLGRAFRHVDALMTNFHLPRSTLMAMVAAFLGPEDGLARLKGLYAEAIGRGYRFYSYGDAMIVLP